MDLVVADAAAAVVVATFAICSIWLSGIFFYALICMCVFVFVFFSLLFKKRFLNQRERKIQPDLHSLNIEEERI